MPQYKKKLKRGDRWYYRFSFQGQIYRSNAVYLSKNEAKKAEILIFKEIEAMIGRVNFNKTVMLLDLINGRLDYLKVAKSDRYYKASRYYLKILYDYFGNINAQDITRGDVQKLLLEQSKRQKQHNRDNYAVNAMHKTFKALFFYGIKYLELNTINPCMGIEPFSIKKKIKYIPTDYEIEELLSKCNSEQRSLVEFVMTTGCRISEALNLKQKDVFNDFVVLYTRKSKSSNQMPREAKYDTSKLVLPNSSDDRVFYQWNDIPRFLFSKTKGKWNWHCLRHRFASILSKKGTPLFEIMTLLGHSNLETTQRYLQLLP